MSNIFSPENYPTIDKLVTIFRTNGGGDVGDPALKSLFWGQKIHEIIDIDPNHLERFLPFAQDENARVEFQLIGILVPFLLEMAAKQRGEYAHYLLFDIDEYHFHRSMKEAEERNPTKQE